MSEAAAEQLVGEETIADVQVRYLETIEGHFFAAGAPVAEEWCYVADATALDELKTAAQAIVGRQRTRSIFIRCAALMGCPWSETAMVPLLVQQENQGRRLMETAPATMDQSTAELRKIKKQAAEETARDN